MEDDWKIKVSIQHSTKINAPSREMIELPEEDAYLRNMLQEITGEKDKDAYIINDYQCPFFEISKYENLLDLNKLAAIIEHLDDKEKLLLKGWCDVHQAGMADLTEIGNAALQINEVDYEEGIVDEEQLGIYIAEKTGIMQAVRKLKKEKDMDGDYIDYERLGNDFNINNATGYYVKGIDGQIQGYMIDDSAINEFELSKEELFASVRNTNEIKESPMQQCMKQTAEKSAGFLRSGKEYER